MPTLPVQAFPVKKLVLKKLLLSRKELFSCIKGASSELQDDLPHRAAIQQTKHNI